MSLVARHLEANGIPTVILGSARDIVEHCGVPRFLFTDFPLGNPCGRPWDPEMQRSLLSLGLELLAAAEAPRTTWRSPFAWPGDGAWRRRYMHVDPSRADHYRRLGDERRTLRAAMAERSL